MREVFYVLGCECHEKKSNKRSPGVQAEAVDEEINGSTGIGFVGVACSNHFCVNIVVGRNILLK